MRNFQTKPPFHPTVFVDIRKRMGASNFEACNALVIERADELKPDKRRTLVKQRMILLKTMIKHKTKAH